MTSGVKLSFFALLTLFILITISVFNKDAVYLDKAPDKIAGETTEFDPPKLDSPLGKVIQNSIDGVEGDFSVYIESIDGSIKYTQNSHTKMEAGSLYKLILLASTYDLINKQKLTEDNVITGYKKHLTEVLGGVDYGYEKADEEISYTVREAVDRIVRISDNFAAIILTEHIRNLEAGRGDPLSRMVKSLGLKETDFTHLPLTTASDVGNFYKQLYNGLIVSTEASVKIIDGLKRSQINSRIPAKLPKGVEVAHKTAELPRLRHDAGIVYLENKPYILVLMSKNLQYEDDGVEALAEISKEVYEYMDKNK